MFLHIQFGTSVAMERNYNALVYISVYTSFLTVADGGEKSTGLAKILPAMLRYSYQPGSASTCRFWGRERRSDSHVFYRKYHMLSHVLPDRMVMPHLHGKCILSWEPSSTDWDSDFWFCCGMIYSKLLNICSSF